MIKKKNFLAVMIIISILGGACKKDGLRKEMAPNEIAVEKQQKVNTFTTNFMIVSAEETQYLGKPESMDAFKSYVSSYIDMAVDKMDCYFVIHINDNGMVQNAVIGKNSTSNIYASWGSRLHGYFEIAREYLTIDIDDQPIIDGVCVTYGRKSDAKKMVSALIDDENVKNVSLTKNGDGTFTVCWEYR